jgi:hypothetical protein
LVERQPSKLDVAGSSPVARLSGTLWNQNSSSDTRLALPSPTVGRILGYVLRRVREPEEGGPNEGQGRSAYVLCPALSRSGAARPYTTADARHGFGVTMAVVPEHLHEERVRQQLHSAESAEPEQLFVALLER